MPFPYFLTRSFIGLIKPPFINGTIELLAAILAENSDGFAVSAGTAILLCSAECVTLNSAFPLHSFAVSTRVLNAGKSFDKILIDPDLILQSAFA